MSAQLQDFFKTCDPDGTRSVDAEAFRDLCSRLNISSQDADLIFEDLDVDNDGKISFGDFSKGFSNFLSTSNEAAVIPDDGTAETGHEEAVKNNVWSTLTAEAEKIGNKTSDEGKLKWLLSELQASEQRHLVPLLEGAVEELLGSLQQLQEEKARLEDSWCREKVEHQKHLKRMEDELDNQVKEVEMRMRLQAQEEVEDERKSLQSKMDTELNKLAAIEKVFGWFRTQCPEPQRDSRLDELRSKLNEAVYDNHQLRMSLLDTQTSIALMRSELMQLRTLYEEKCRELSSEKEKIMEVLQEQDHLSRQLNLLHDANRRLLDSHDALKSSMEISGRQGLGSAPRNKRGSVVGDYLDLNYSRECLDKFPEQEEPDEEEAGSGRTSRLRRARSMDVVSSPIPLKSANQSDSGVSTVRDSFEPDDNWEPRTPEDEDREARSRHSSRRGSSVPPPEVRKSQLCPTKESIGNHRLRSSTSEDSLLESEAFPRRRISDIKKQLGIKDEPVSWRRNWSPQQCSTPRDCSNGRPPKPLPRLSKVSGDDVSKEVDSDSVLLISAEPDESEFEPDGPAEQTFKVIFVGDASVGKSSFALRISKGVFVRHMSSTLGLDFLMRTIRVDGRNVAVQLWDTAGQERFRSITKSYFRKADGVMLLYDCTCEQSFLNVRQWVEDIDKAAFQRIPLMIVANKIDLREMALQTGQTCVSTEQGEKLAKDCDTTFMEASAKNGSNVLPALANLIRSMSTHQDLQLSASTMQLCEAKPKKGGCCGK